MPVGKSIRKRGPSILLLSAAAVALIYGGIAGWLALTGDSNDGKPVVAMKIAPDTTEPKTPANLRTDDTATANNNSDEKSATPGATPLPSDATSADHLTPAELSLLEAAQKLNGANNSGDSDNMGDIKIVGADSVSGGTNNTPDNLKPIGPLEPVAPLKAVPDPALIEKTATGPLPIIAKDGRKAYQVYARPLPANIPDGPRIALVVSGLGISESATKHAIEVLPPEVTLSFAPYGDNLQGWIAKARQAGHEVLLELPMEPYGYPQNDPGPNTLLTSLAPSENVSRLQWLLSRFTGYIGVMNYQGARFITNQAALSPILSALKSRGLSFVDNGASTRSLVSEIAPQINLPYTLGTQSVDPVRTSDVISKSFATLEESAKGDEPTVGIASGFPVTVDAIAEWAKTLPAKGITLVPVSATLHD